MKCRLRMTGNPAASVLVVVSTVIVLVRGSASAPTAAAAAAPAAGAWRSFVAVLGLLDVRATFSHFPCTKSCKSHMFN